MKSSYLIIGLVALATAATIFELAANDSDPRQQVRIIDLPPVTEAALLTSGIDRQTLNDYLAQTSVEVPYGPVTAYISQPNGKRISSSIAIETDRDAIRLGLKPVEGGEKDNGWVPFEIPKEVLLSTRMHLSREQVRALLPILKKFVKTGELE